MAMLVGHGRKNAGNLHQSVPPKVFFGRPRPNDYEKP